jgi:hypothetical protein
MDRKPLTHAEYRDEVTRRQVELLQERGIWARPDRVAAPTPEPPSTPTPAGAEVGVSPGR